MKASVLLGRLTPVWLMTYAGVILLVGVFVNLAASFTQFTHSLTLPSMQASLGLSYTQAGVLITLAASVRIVSSLVAGTLAPRYGSRAIIGLGAIGAGASMLLLGASPNYGVALLAMALMGLTAGCALTPMMGLLSPWFRMQDRGLAAGLAASGGSVAFVVAGVMVPWLTGQNPDQGWRFTWYLAGLVVITVGVVALVFLRDRPEDHRPAGGRRVRRNSRRGSWPLAAYKSPLVWLVTALAFCSGWAQSIFTTFYGAYLTQDVGLPLGVAGQLLVLMGVLSIGSGVLWGKVSDRLGRGQGFLLSFLLQGAGFAMFWLAPALGVLLVAALFMGLTLRATYTICAACAGDYVPVEYSAAAFALMSVGAGLGSSISPVIAGAIADATGTLGWSFAMALGSTLAGVVGGLALHRVAAMGDVAAASSEGPVGPVLH